MEWGKDLVRITLGAWGETNLRESGWKLSKGAALRTGRGGRTAKVGIEDYRSPAIHPAAASRLQFNVYNDMFRFDGPNHGPTRLCFCRRTRAHSIKIDNWATSYYRLVYSRYMNIQGYRNEVMRGASMSVSYS